MCKLKVGIIGCGNMGCAITRGIAGKNGFTAGNIFVFDKDEEKATRLAEETGVIRKGLADLVNEADILVIAVKPHDFEALANEMAEDITTQTVVSIMAGVRIEVIDGKLGPEKVSVARAMPNIAASVGESVTCVAYNDGAIRIASEIRGIFSGIGEVVEMEEALLDVVTALSGSGPAYLFYLARAMMEAGREMGLTAATAEKLVTQTLYGSAALLKQKGLSPENLIHKVASKGGTTEAALSVLDKKDVTGIIKSAIKKAKERSKELSGG